MIIYHNQYIVFSERIPDKEIKLPYPTDLRLANLRDFSIKDKFGRKAEILPSQTYHRVFSNEWGTLPEDVLKQISDLDSLEGKAEILIQVGIIREYLLRNYAPHPPQKIHPLIIFTADEKYLIESEARAHLAAELGFSESQLVVAPTMKK